MYVALGKLTISMGRFQIHSKVRGKVRAVCGIYTNSFFKVSMKFQSSFN